MIHFNIAHNAANAAIYATCETLPPIGHNMNGLSLHFIL